MYKSLWRCLPRISSPLGSEADPAPGTRCLHRQGSAGGLSFRGVQRRLNFANLHTAWRQGDSDVRTSTGPGCAAAPATIVTHQGACRDGLASEPARTRAPPASVGNSSSLCDDGDCSFDLTTVRPSRVDLRKDTWKFHARWARRGCSTGRVFRD
jgi:hypothetical protein